MEEPSLKNKKNENIDTVFGKMHPLTRFFISISAALLVFLFTAQWSVLLRLLFSWSVFAVAFLTFSWIVIFTRPVSRIKEYAKADDGSVLFVSLMVLVSSFAGMFTVLLMMISKDDSIKTGIAFPLLCISGILLSWTMVHTIYVFHYAHEYYGENQKTGGLEFPNEKTPDYLDFAYFSFVMGCTFQVSDVSITSRRLRRIAMIHGILSFALNTFVVALTINLIAGLAK